MPRPLPISRIGAGLRMEIAAKPDELGPLAARMGIPAVHSLSCRFDLRRGEAGAIEAVGLLQARLSQVCVVTLEPFESDLVEHFTLQFVPAGQESEQLDLDADDEMPYEGGVLELGEAACQQLALAMDPFPRKPGAELPASVSDPEEGAFAALAKLRSAH